MGAPLGFKTFATGDVLTAADTNGYLMQGVWTFASATARDAAVTSPQEGNMCYLKDTDAVQYYSGSAWTAVGGSSYVGCKLTKSSSQTVSAISTYTALTWNSEIFDTSNFHDNATNNSRITIPTGKAGKYLLTFSAYLSATNVKRIGWYVNGSRTQTDIANWSNYAGGTTFSFLANLSAADYVEVFVWNDSSTIYYSTAEETLPTVFTASYLGA
jgi:hypothetical protein